MENVPPQTTDSPGTDHPPHRAKGHPAGAASGGRKAAGDAIFSVSERVISQLSQFAIFLLAARILGPAEFGLFALASACAMLLLSVAEVAWVPFILSREGDEKIPLQVLFVAIVHGIIFGCAGATAALSAGWFGLGHDLTVLAMLFSLWVALANASRAQKGVLIWMDRLKAGSLCEMGGELAGLAVAVYALRAGMGVFALVYSRLACQTVILVLSFTAMRRLPLPGLPREVFRELWWFSVHFFTSRMLIQARLQFVTLIIGGFLGPAAVGFYRAAERLIGAVAELIIVPAQLLAWTHLRRARDQGDPTGRLGRINRQATQHLKVIAALGAPLFLWLMLMNEPLIAGLLGPQWAPAGTLVAILAIGRLGQLPGILTEPLMTILGAVRCLPPFVAGIFAISVTITLISAPFGVVAIAWGQTIIGMIVMVTTCWLFGRKAGLRWQSLIHTLRPLAAPLALGVLAILILDAAIAGQDLPALVRAVVAGLGGGVVYLAALAVFDHAIFSQFTLVVQRRRRPEVSP